MNTLKISQKIYEHYESKETIMNYYGLLAIYGLVQTAEVSEDSELTEKFKKILSNFPDKMEHPRYNFPNYKIGGIAKAYAFMKGFIPEAKEQVREYADEMMKATRDSKGIMCNPYKPKEELIWVDIAMAVTPYLLFAGTALKEQSYIDEAAKQTFLIYEEFLDTDNGLLHQCKNFVGPGKYSEDHWSRGNGWGFLGLAELVQYLPKDSIHREKAERYFKDLSKAMLPYQSSRGLWRQEIPFEYSYEEASGSGLILYGYGVGIRMGILDKETYMPSFIKGINGLNDLTINEDFSTELGCPECLCPGEDEEKGTIKAYVTLKLPYTDEHHSFGLIMLPLVEAYKNGIVDLKRN
ncbi:glycoside hydrolase family 88 protein [Clostridium lacusfryxellense]|uniref:glycoside hydrolase family 88 protein n=1 Tax=Clostridium lacusfryxellense TaxID=205328 RepID=UPI001C0AEB3C|nr:glycoside hydrolase family 88 protein [Clostridium lacusfryxellense]MBU3113859.1 glycoside hydrolase family 88 protein [Clostridium lacusfryxellense]